MVLEDFPAKIGVRVRGVSVVRGYSLQNYGLPLMPGK